MGNFETPSQTTVRLGREKRITEYQNAGDSYHANAELDVYRYGQARADLSAAAMYRLLRAKGSRAARLFEKQAREEANQETTEIPVVTQEMLDAA